MERIYRDAIKEEFINCVSNTIKRVELSLKKQKAGGNYKPFHDVLLIPEAILWSKFERSFSTSFGQRLVEEVSRQLALSSGAVRAERQKLTDFVIDQSQADAIERHLQEIKEGRLKGKWIEDLQIIAGVAQVDILHHAAIISDLWFVRDNIEYFFSIKTVKPNIDQTAEAKRDLLKIKLSHPDSRAYFGLYYNPWGENRSDYKHNPPMRVFDFVADDVVLIGKEYWETIGGHGAYEQILDIAAEAGEQTKVLIEGFSARLK